MKARRPNKKMGRPIVTEGLNTPHKHHNDKDPKF